MLAEVRVFGALAPSLLIYFLVALSLFVPIDQLAARVGAYRFVWHPSLARFGLFLCLFAGLALLA
jgi:hypothetical protein